MTTRPALAGECPQRAACPEAGLGSHQDWAKRVGARRLDELRATLELLRRSWLAEQ